LSAIPTPATSTGMDDASLKQELKEARAKVTYRKKLLAELDAKEKHKQSERHSAA
jgi:hypothetical protein